MNGQPKVLTEGIRRIHLRVSDDQAGEETAIQDDELEEDDVPDDQSDSGCYFADKDDERRNGDDVGLEEDWEFPPDETPDDEEHLMHQVTEFAQGATGGEDDSDDEDDLSGAKGKRGGKKSGRKKAKAKAKGKAKGKEDVNTDQANYEFCPLAHRLPILRLFAKHFCQHTLLPERHGRYRSKHDIRHDAVLEMYTHCVNNNLREVWAYLWMNWYKPN